MSTLNKTCIIMFAVLIDFLQATLSAGVAAIAAFAGTLGGAAAGCYVANQVISSETSCAAGAAIGAFFGTVANPIASTVALPLGIALGIALTLCISFTFGTIFYLWLWSTKLWYPGQIWLPALLKTIPILSDLPAFTFTAVRCVIQKNLEEKKLQQSPSNTFGTMLAPGTMLGGAAATAYTLNHYTQRKAVAAGLATDAGQTARREEFKNRTTMDLRRMDGIYAKTSPQEARSRGTIDETAPTQPLYVQPA